MKTLISASALALFLSLGAAWAQTSQTPDIESPATIETGLFWDLVDKNGKAKIYDAACCKVCRKGKACGNSCINKSYNCHKGVGCACNG